MVAADGNEREFPWSGEQSSSTTGEVITGSFACKLACMLSLDQTDTVNDSGESLGLIFRSVAGCALAMCELTL